MLGERLRARFLLPMIVAFFIFQLYLFVKSFPAEYGIYLRFLERVQTGDPFWVSFWFGSELVGEVGLIVRFAGACFAVIFGWFLVKKGEIVFSHLRKAVLFEGAYYFFILPFIVSLFARPNTSIVNVEAGLSYTLQIALVTPLFFSLYVMMKKPDLDMVQIYRRSALAIVGFTFALWVKHLLLNLYALPVNLADPVLLIGFLNSALTIFLAGVILVIAFWPLIRKKQVCFNSKPAGVAFLLVGVYFLIYLAISLLNQSYMSFLGLTELWAAAFVIPGLGFITGETS